MDAIIFFKVIAILAIAAGGLISAAWAHKPSRVIMWCSAYLVLVVGLVQLGISYKATTLAIGATTLGLSLALYNIGNLLVIIGRFNRSSFFGPRMVYLGGLFLAIAMLRLLLIGPLDGWLMILGLTIMLGMPTGLYLTARSKRLKG